MKALKILRDFYIKTYSLTFLLGGVVCGLIALNIGEENIFTQISSISLIPFVAVLLWQLIDNKFEKRSIQIGLKTMLVLLLILSVYLAIAFYVHVIIFGIIAYVVWMFGVLFYFAFAFLKIVFRSIFITKEIPASIITACCVSIIMLFILGGFLPEVTCNDGWSSPSIGSQGACSHHGGVKSNNGWIILIFIVSCLSGFGVYRLLEGLQKK